jgi:nitroimidazol reductase NimA-like FMN-containing flavoprotein (pyridoxamine 5'-phosphate oxidase superfamily)
MRHDLTFDDCEKILLDGHYGHLGFIANGEPHVLPVTYVYKYGYIFSHTSEGEKIEMMRTNKRVCLQVERVRSGYDWDSVACWGDYEEVTDAEQIREIHQLLAEQYARITQGGGEAPVSPLIQDLHLQHAEKRPVIYRINILKTTGRSEKPKHG